MGVPLFRMPPLPHASRAAAWSTPQAGPHATVAMAQQQPGADPADLVARALKILADENAAWQAGCATNRPAGRAR